jgi:hypothetical protein
MPEAPMSDHEERKDEEHNLIGILERIQRDIAFVEEGGFPAQCRGHSREDILGRLLRHRRNVRRAIEHVRSGGALTDIVPIVWGDK